MEKKQLEIAHGRHDLHGPVTDESEVAFQFGLRCTLGFEMCAMLVVRRLDMLTHFRVFPRHPTRAHQGAPRYETRTLDAPSHSPSNHQWACRRRRLAAEKLGG